MVLTLKATEEGVGSWKAAGCLSMSLLIIFVQCLVLFVVMFGNSHPRCNGHDDCKSGEWCAPIPLINQLSPGGCQDCFSSIEPWVGVRDDEFWQEAAAHCVLTDKIPLRW